jgi:hypothetical protein
MKRKPPNDRPTIAYSTDDIKANLTEKQLAAFGAAALAYNIIEDQIDALLSIATRIPDWLFAEVSSRIHGLGGKIAIIQAAIEHSPLKAIDAKALKEAVATFGDFKTIRDTMIHARIINATLGRGAKQRGKSLWEVLLSVEALNTFYDHIVALNKELSSGGTLLNSAITLQQTASTDPNRSQLEEALRVHEAQFRENRTHRRSLKPLPKFPDEDQLRKLANQHREAQVGILMSWFQPSTELPQPRSWLHPGVTDWWQVPPPPLPSAPGTSEKEPQK